MLECANCGHPHNHSYCPTCGQGRVAPGVRLGEVLGDFLSGLYNVDAPILYTLRSFFAGPGKLTHSYLAGKRKAYTPPVRLFLLGVGFYYLMRWVLQWDPVDAAVLDAGLSAVPDTPAMQVNHWMSRNVNLLLPILMTMLASFDRLLFPRTTLNWTERLVHYLFAVGTYLIAATLLIPLYQFWPGLQLLGMLTIFGILIAAAIALHRITVWNVVKAVVMVPVTFMLYVVLCTVLVALLLDVPLDQLMQRPPR
ncbi:MAG: DUF3667 domain-containing protein [Flavobacteriales bacterium]|nr:DUF3667 domain-containing protein [Flavobacteriales bacterium]